MEEELEKLRAQIAEVSRDIADINLELAASKAFEEHVVMPMLLRLSGFGHQKQVDDFLAGLLVHLGDLGEGKVADRQRRRVAYWREQAKKKPEWLAFAPGGFAEEDEA
ncbi:hypothetical protein [Sphingobium yanoikuyae]|uniref:hypothetical protein n=1 Tax=Sphingobium yanoikuyae TaxID=13690 RepID=UPI000262C4B8|nr:hypothetical protein [Sphingobium yanoikuyae]